MAVAVELGDTLQVHSSVKPHLPHPFPDDDGTNHSRGQVEQRQGCKDEAQLLVRQEGEERKKGERGPHDSEYAAVHERRCLEHPDELATRRALQQSGKQRTGSRQPQLEARAITNLETEAHLSPSGTSSEVASSARGSAE